MKKIKAFPRHIKHCFEAYQLRRITSELLGRSLLSDLKYLMRSILRGQSETQATPTLVWGTPGAGRVRYCITPSMMPITDESSPD